MKNNTIEVTTNLHTVTSLMGQMTLPVSVYRNTDKMFPGMDCTNGGVSAKEDDLLIITADGFIPITKDNVHQVVSLCVGHLGNKYVSPVVRNPLNNKGQRKSVGPCFGGNFVYSCDSRFHELSNYPLPIHDRWDTQEDADFLSR